MWPSSLFQLAETKAYKKQNITLTDHNKLDFLHKKRLLKIIQKKAFKKGFENSGILAVGCREICVFQRVYPVFIFPCKFGGFSFSCFYVSDLSYTVLRSSFLTLEQSLIYTKNLFPGLFCIPVILFLV